MNCLPVIEMEMRSASRRKWTFIVRLLFALSGAATCLAVLALPEPAPARKGHIMLVLLSYLSLAFCLFAGGFLTADCVSSEKRDGTLGLLFLTPLNGMDIVLGKMVCHGLQMFYGLCAVFPVFFLPLLAGGVTWSEVSRIVLALALALMLGSSIGVLVSVLATDSRRTMMATIASLVFVAALPMMYLVIRHAFFTSPARLQGLPQLSPICMISSAFEASYTLRDGPILFWGSAIACLALSSALVFAAGALLGRIFARLAEQRDSLRPADRWPIPAAEVLERNPYEWALLRTGREARSLGILTHALLLFFVVMLLASVITSHWQEGFIAAFFTAFAIHVVAKLRFAVEATRQINLDRQSGAMELLLVTTLSPYAILNGHQSALRVLSYGPLALLLILNSALELFVLLFPETLHMDRQATIMFSLFFVGGMVLAFADFSALRCVGLLRALQMPTHIKAAVAAFSSTMLLPWVGMGLVMGILTNTQPRTADLTLTLAAWIGGSLLYDWFLVRLNGFRLQTGIRRLASESS